MPRSEGRIVDDLLIDIKEDYLALLGILYALYSAEKLSPGEIYNKVVKKFGERSFSNRARLSFKDCFWCELHTAEADGLAESDNGTFVATPLGERIFKKISGTLQYKWLTHTLYV